MSTRTKIQVLWSTLTTCAIFAFKIKTSPTEENHNLINIFISNYLMLWKPLDNAIDYQIYKLRLIRSGVDPLKAMCLSGKQVKSINNKIKKEEYLWASTQKWPNEDIVKKNFEPTNINWIIMIIQSTAYLITFYIRLSLKMNFFQIEIIANFYAVMSLIVLILSYKRPLCHEYIIINNMPEFNHNLKSLKIIELLLETIGIIIRFYVMTWWGYLMWFEFPTKTEKYLFIIGCLGTIIIYINIYIFGRLLNIISKKILKKLEIIYCILLINSIIIVLLELRTNNNITNLLIATPWNDIIPHI